MKISGAIKIRSSGPALAVQHSHYGELLRAGVKIYERDDGILHSKTMVIDRVWTIVGSSPLAKTYRSKRDFIEEVIDPFNARMAKPLVPAVRGIFADGDMVITLFDAAATTKENKPYQNTYTWHFQMKDDRVVKAIAFFDNRDFDDFWTRVSPQS